MKSTSSRVLAIVARMAAAVPGGYALMAATVALMGGLLPMTGAPRSEAVVLAAMLGFVLYLGFLIWAFATPSLIRLWSVVLCGTGLACAAVWALH